LKEAEHRKLDMAEREAIRGRSVDRRSVEAEDSLPSIEINSNAGLPVKLVKGPFMGIEPDSTLLMMMSGAREKLEAEAAEAGWSDSELQEKIAQAKLLADAESNKQIAARKAQWSRRMLEVKLEEAKQEIEAPKASGWKTYKRGKDTIAKELGWTDVHVADKIKAANDDLTALQSELLGTKRGSSRRKVLQQKSEAKEASIVAMRAGKEEEVEEIQIQMSDMTQAEAGTASWRDDAKMVFGLVASIDDGDDDVISKSELILAHNGDFGLFEKLASLNSDGTVTIDEWLTFLQTTMEKKKSKAAGARWVSSMLCTLLNHTKALPLRGLSARKAVDVLEKMSLDDQASAMCGMEEGQRSAVMALMAPEASVAAQGGGDEQYSSDEAGDTQSLPEPMSTSEEPSKDRERAQRAIDNPIRAVAEYTRPQAKQPFHQLMPGDNAIFDAKIHMQGLKTERAKTLLAVAESKEETTRMVVAAVTAQSPQGSDGGGADIEERILGRLLPEVEELRKALVDTNEKLVMERQHVAHLEDWACHQDAADSITPEAAASGADIEERILGRLLPEVEELRKALVDTNEKLVMEKQHVADMEDWACHQDAATSKEDRLRIEALELALKTAMEKLGTEQSAPSKSEESKDTPVNEPMISGSAKKSSSKWTRKMLGIHVVAAEEKLEAEAVAAGWSKVKLEAKKAKAKKQIEENMAAAEAMVETAHQPPEQEKETIDDLKTSVVEELKEEIQRLRHEISSVEANAAKLAMDKVDRIQTELDWINHNGGEAVNMIESAMQRHEDLQNELDWMCHRMAELQVQENVHEKVQAQMKELHETAKIGLPGSDKPIIAPSLEPELASTPDPVPIASPVAGRDDQGLLLAQENVDAIKNVQAELHAVQVKIQDLEAVRKQPAQKTTHTKNTPLPTEAPPAAHDDREEELAAVRLQLEEAQAVLERSVSEAAIEAEHAALARLTVAQEAANAHVALEAEKAKARAIQDEAQKQRQELKEKADQARAEHEQAMSETEELAQREAIAHAEETRRLQAALDATKLAHQEALATVDPAQAEELRKAHEGAESARLAQQEEHLQREKELAAAKKELEAIRAKGEAAAEAARVENEKHAAESAEEQAKREADLTASKKDMEDAVAEARAAADAAHTQQLKQMQAEAEASKAAFQSELDAARLSKQQTLAAVSPDQADKLKKAQVEAETARLAQLKEHQERKAELTEARKELEAVQNALEDEEIKRRAAQDEVVKAKEDEKAKAARSHAEHEKVMADAAAESAEKRAEHQRELAAAEAALEEEQARRKAAEMDAAQKTDRVSVETLEAADIQMVTVEPKQEALVRENKELPVAELEYTAHEEMQVEPTSDHTRDAEDKVEEERDNLKREQEREGIVPEKEDEMAKAEESKPLQTKSEPETAKKRSRWSKNMLHADSKPMQKAGPAEEAVSIEPKKQSLWSRKMLHAKTKEVEEALKAEAKKSGWSRKMLSARIAVAKEEIFEEMQDGVAEEDTTVKDEKVGESNKVSKWNTKMLGFANMQDLKVAEAEEKLEEQAKRSGWSRRVLEVKKAYAKEKIEAAVLAEEAALAPAAGGWSKKLLAKKLVTAERKVQAEAKASGWSKKMLDMKLFLAKEKVEQDALQAGPPNDAKPEQEPESPEHAQQRSLWNRELMQNKVMIDAKQWREGSGDRAGWRNEFIEVKMAEAKQEILESVMLPEGMALSFESMVDEERENLETQASEAEWTMKTLDVKTEMVKEELRREAEMVKEELRREAEMVKEELRREAESESPSPSESLAESLMAERLKPPQEPNDETVQQVSRWNRTKMLSTGNQMIKEKLEDPVYVHEQVEQVQEQVAQRYGSPGKRGSREVSPAAAAAMRRIKDQHQTASAPDAALIAILDKDDGSETSTESTLRRKSGMSRLHHAVATDIDEKESDRARRREALQKAHSRKWKNLLAVPSPPAREVGRGSSSPEIPETDTERVKQLHASKWKRLRRPADLSEATRAMSEQLASRHRSRSKVHDEPHDAIPHEVAAPAGFTW